MACFRPTFASKPGMVANCVTRSAQASGSRSRFGCRRRAWCNPFLQHQEQFVRVERFDDAVDHAVAARQRSISTCRALVMATIGSCANRGQLADCRRDAVHHRHLHIHQHQIVRRLLHFVQRDLAVFGNIDDAAGIAQQAAGTNPDSPVVFREQDARTLQMRMRTDAAVCLPALPGHAAEQPRVRATVEAQRRHNWFHQHRVETLPSSATGATRRRRRAPPELPSAASAHARSVSFQQRCRVHRRQLVIDERGIEMSNAIRRAQGRERPVDRGMGIGRNPSLASMRAIDRRAQSLATTSSRCFLWPAARRHPDRMAGGRREQSAR